jgi:hypothetical protein
MDITLWILGCWLALGAAVGLWIASFIRSGQELAAMPSDAPLSRPGRAAPPR